MTATRHSTNLINMKKPPNKMYRTERSTEKQKRDRFFSSGSVTYEQWNRQCTAQYKVAYWEWKERQQLARNHTMAQRSRNTKQTTGYPGTGKRAAQVVRVQSAKRKVVPSQKVHTDRPTQKSDRKPLETFCNNVDADSKLLGTPSSNKELPVDMNDPGASRDENVPGLADKTEAKSCTFAGQRRRKRDSQERLVVELTIPPSQYWAIVEGVATMSDTEDRASFLEQIILEGRSENLPKDGRLLELMPLEAMPGKWTLDLKSTTGNDLLHDDYDLLREDWSTKRLVVRHESHQHVQNNTPTSWNGYSKATVDPSNHRVGSMMSQGILLNEESISIVFAVSLIAFEGFFSAHECRLSALPVARKTLQNLHWGDGFPPKMISIPQFESELEGAFASQSYKIVAAGGAGLIGCFVDDIFKSMTDYKIDVICHDASNQVVGMDCK